MTTNDIENPYQPPESVSASSPQAQRKRPGILTMIGILVVSLFAAGCAFFCSCLGVVFLGFPLMQMLKIGEAGVAIGLIICTMAATAAGIGMGRALVRSATTPKAPIRFDESNKA